MSGWRTGFAAIAATVVGAIGVAAEAQAQAAFVPALGSPYPVAGDTSSLVVADGDRSGTLDVASGRLLLLRGDGTGRLGAARTIGVTAALDDLAVGSLAGDVLPDYAALEQGSPDRVAAFTGLVGGGYLRTEASSDVGDAAALAVGDVTGDGLEDIVVAGSGPPGSLTVLRNAGGGLFVATDHGLGGAALESVALADFSGDGRLDAAVGTDDGELRLLLGEADGELTPAPGPWTPSGESEAIGALAVADFDSDGLLDLAVPRGGGIALFKGDGMGGLAPLGPRQPGGAVGDPLSVSAGDVNGDGWTDVAVGGPTGYVSVLLGDGRGALVPLGGSPFWTGGVGALDAVRLGDMNRDGQLDLVTGGSGPAAVLLNTQTGLMQATPRNVDFGVMPARGAPVTLSVSYQSTRGRLMVSRVVVERARGLFKVVSNDCVRRWLLVGHSCTATVSFSPPRRAGLAEALLTVDANAAAVVVPLTAHPRPPMVSSLALRPRKVRRGKRMRLRYALSEAARVRVEIERRLQGRRAGRRCVASRSPKPRGRRCALWERVARVAQLGEPGVSRRWLRARARGRALPVGSYRVVVSASDQFRNRSDEQTLTFRVRKPARRPAPRRRGSSPPQAATRGAK